MPALNLQAIGITILAAGSSQRFGGDKRQALMPNQLSLLENTLNNIPDSFTRKLLVLHEGDETLAEKFSKQGWSICIAKDSEQGMGNSLATAMQAQDGWQGMVIGLGDMPFIKPETYQTIQTLLCQNKIVIPLFQEQRGNPVGFQAQYFDELSDLRGDQGARGLLKKYSLQCHHYETSDGGILRDIDTVAALNE